MPPTLTYNPAFTVAVALLAGLIAQAIAFRVGIPGIVLLLVTGVVLGPDGIGLIQPDILGRALSTLVSFAVAVILFEGGLNLNIVRLRREQAPIRRLITVGAFITWMGGTLAARYIMHWDWRTSLLFGSLVIVTGPTVITPLVRRLKVERSVSTVLEAEGVLMDAIGALVAFFTLEFAVSPTGATLARGVVQVATRLLFGAAIGFLGGGLLVLVLRTRRLIPEGLENVTTLAAVLAIAQLANAGMGESGIVAVVTAGLVVANANVRMQRDLLEFKEQLTLLFVGMLFVLLAADIRIWHVQSLGFDGLMVVLALIFVIRPLNVFVSTWGTDLTLKKRLFLSWMGPRGLVAASLASLFAIQLDALGMSGGTELRALVFLVITGTVVVAGLTGSSVARALGLQRPRNAGWVLLGAHDLARTLAQVLHNGGEDVLCIDSNPEACRQTERAGIKAIYGNALEGRIMRRAEIDTRIGAIGLTPNDEVNLLFCQKAKQEGRIARIALAVGSSVSGATPEMLNRIDGEILFGEAKDVHLWSLRLHRQSANLQRYVLINDASDESIASLSKCPDGLFLVLATTRAGKVSPFTNKTRLKRDDELYIIINNERTHEIDTWLNPAEFIRS